MQSIDTPPTRRYAKYLLKRRDQAMAAYGFLTWLTLYHLIDEGADMAWFDHKWGFTNGYTAVMTDDARFYLGGGRERVDLSELTPERKAELLQICRERIDYFEARVDSPPTLALIRGMFGDTVTEVFCRTEQTLARDAKTLLRKKRARSRAGVQMGRPAKKDSKKDPWK